MSGRATTALVLAIGGSLFLGGCPRQGPQLGPGDDGLYAVAVELSHPSSAATLLQDSVEVPPEHWATVERMDRSPSRWENGQPVEWTENGHSVEFRLQPLPGRMLSLELRYSFHQPITISGSQAIVLAAEQLDSCEVDLSSYQLRLRIEP